jgi:hypothetical protein
MQPTVEPHWLRNQVQEIRNCSRNQSLASELPIWIKALTFSVLFLSVQRYTLVARGCGLSAYFDLRFSQCRVLGCDVV